MVRKVTLSLPGDLLDRIDQYAADNSLTRSGLVATACKQFLVASETTPAMTKLISKFADLVGSAMHMQKETLAADLDQLESERQLILGQFKE